MQISSLITRLEEIKVAEGDIPVVVEIKWVGAGGVTQSARGEVNSASVLHGETAKKALVSSDDLKVN